MSDSNKRYLVVLTNTERHFIKCDKDGAITCYQSIEGAELDTIAANPSKEAFDELSPAVAPVHDISSLDEYVDIPIKIHNFIFDKKHIIYGIPINSKGEKLKKGKSICSGT